MNKLKELSEQMKAVNNTIDEIVKDYQQQINNLCVETNMNFICGMGINCTITDLYYVDSSLEYFSLDSLEKTVFTNNCWNSHKVTQTKEDFYNDIEWDELEEDFTKEEMNHFKKQFNDLFDYWLPLFLSIKETSLEIYKIIDNSEFNLFYLFSDCKIK